MPISKDYQTVICHTDKVNGKIKNQIRILMTYLTDKEESYLNQDKSLTIERGGITFDLDKDNVFAYGEVDFHKDTDDYEALRDLIPFNDIVNLPDHYDYDTHTCQTTVNGYQTRECRDIGAMAQYAHGKLGKPNKVVIFKLIAKRW